MITNYRFYELPGFKSAGGQACFLGRRGGVSEGKYASLNVRDRSSDDPRAVAENRRIAVRKAGMNPGSWLCCGKCRQRMRFWLNRLHKALLKLTAWSARCRGWLGIGTADCLPVLLADYEHGVIGAAHAGWRGAVRGVVENTLKLMLAQGRFLKEFRRLWGRVFSSLLLKSTAPTFVTNAAVLPAYAAFFCSRKDACHFQFDLEGLVRRRWNNLVFAILPHRGSILMPMRKIISVSAGIPTRADRLRQRFWRACVVDNVIIFFIFGNFWSFNQVLEDINVI